MAMPHGVSRDLANVHEYEVESKVFSADAKTATLEFDEDSTDVGSGVSDVESTCSSVNITRHLAVGKKLKPGQVLSTTPNAGAPLMEKNVGGRRRRPVPRSLCLGGDGYFTGTPLEPIPGTPEPLSPQKRKAKSAAAFRSCNDIGNLDAMLPGFRPPPGLSSPSDLCRPRSQTVFAYGPPAECGMADKPARAAMGTSSSLPLLPYSSASSCVSSLASPKRCARDRMLTKARQDAMPVKVALPELAMLPCTKILDPTLPVKKKSAFANSVGEVALQKLEPSMPVKKRVSAFLLTEPPQVLPSVVQPR